MSRHSVQQRTLAVCLSLFLLLSVLPTVAQAESAEDYPTYTALYLDKGAITIGDGTVSGYDANGVAVTTPNDAGYYITQTDKNTEIKNTIKITGGSHTIILDSLNLKLTSGTKNVIDISSGTQDITINDVTITAPVSASKSIIALSNSAKLNLTILGTNAFESTKNASTINVPEGTEFTITAESSGSLTLNSPATVASGVARVGAVIGSRADQNAGTIVINGGTIDINGGEGIAAGIGAGDGTSGGGTVVINGGKIFVLVRNAAAIGEGTQSTTKGTVTINGGTIYARRIASSEEYLGIPAIGAVYPANTGTTVTITGGSIRAETIYNDEIATTKYIETLTSSLYLAKVQVKDASDTPMTNAVLTGITANGSAYGSTDVYTDAEGLLYLWLPAGENEISFIVGETTYTASGEVKDDNSSFFTATENANDPNDPTYTALYLDKGAITIGDGTVSGYDADGVAVTTPNDAGYYITQTDKNTEIKNTIKITGGSHTIILDSLNLKLTSGTKNVIDISSGTQDITINDVTITAPVSASKSIIALSNSAKLNLTILGTNTFESTKNASTINVPEGTEFTIMSESSGSLTLNSPATVASGVARVGAVIGSRADQNAGTIIINGGTIDINGGEGIAAGIGAGDGASGCGTVIINGGKISVIVRNAAAIGDGTQSTTKGTVTINGGTIYARRLAGTEDYLDIPAIGAVYPANTGTTVTITGGSIHAETIYNDEVVTTKYIETLTSDLYLTKVQVKDTSDTAIMNAAVTGIMANGSVYGSTDVYTDGEGWLYLWLPAGDTTVTFTCDGENYSISGTVGTDNKTILGDDSGSGSGSGGGEDPQDPQNPQNPQDPESLKAAAIAAFLEIPVYDGTNQEAIDAKIPAAEAALTAAMEEWSPLEFRNWEGYRRYADALALQDIYFPTVTLTVMGQPENDSETAHYYIPPTNYTVPAGSTVAEVVCAALDNAGFTAGVDYTFEGEAGWNGGFFLTSVGSQHNTGRIGWMYMVDNNTYISHGMDMELATDGANILLFYSLYGYSKNSTEFNQSDREKTPYGTYASFSALKSAAGSAVNLGTADAIMEKDWELISKDISSIRIHTDAVALTAVGANGSSIVWNSEYPNVVANDGRITLQDAETQVNLTATLSYGGQSKQKSLTVTVGKAVGTDVTLTISGAAANDNLALGPTALSGLTGIEKYTMLEAFEYFEYGKNIAALDALVMGLGENTATLILENPDTADASIGTLFGLGYNAATGRQWMVQVKNSAGVPVYTGDCTDNLLISLAGGDTVHYRYIAGTAVLQALFESVADVNGSTYSEASYAAFDEARTAAETLLDGEVFDLTQTDVDDACAALQSAYAGLEFALDYFAGEENSPHQKVLNWLADNPLDYQTSEGKTTFGWAMDASGASALVALAMNDMITDDLIYQLTQVGNAVTGAYGVVLNTNLQASTPAYSQIQAMLALTMEGSDMLYYSDTDSRITSYAMDKLMHGSTGDGNDNNRNRAYRLMALNGPVYYPEYQNRIGSDQTVYVFPSGWGREEMSTGLTREYLLSSLLSSQHNDGGWTANPSDALTTQSNALVTAYVLMAMAPYYYGDIPMPETMNLAALKAACNSALEYMQSPTVKADRFNSTTWATQSENSQICLNALMFYGIDPESIKTDTGDGMITYTLKTYLTEDMTHFEVSGQTSQMAGRHTARFAEMMEYYKQYKTKGRASLYGGQAYQNQAVKIELEQAFFEARFVTLGYDPNATEPYTKAGDYPEDAVTALLGALDTAYSVLGRLDSTAEQIASAKQGIDTAVAALTSSGGTPDEVPEEKISITETANGPVANVESVVTNGTATLTVTADIPCVVIVKNGDSYTRLTATDNGNGGYDFSQPRYDPEMEFIVAVKGDYNGDGEFDTSDLARANRDLISPSGANNPLKNLIMGIANGAELETTDLAKLNRAIVNDNLTW